MEDRYSALTKLIDTEVFFYKCKASFLDCIAKEENAFLLEEIDTKSENLDLQNSTVSIKLIDGFLDYFEVESQINILDKKKTLLGYYKLIEDSKGCVVDEVLVFD